MNRKILSHLIIVFSILFFSCSPIENPEQLITNEREKVWYIQAEFDLSHQIKMFNPNEGIAISRGRGEDVKGRAYKFKDGKWTAFDSFDYSDFPHIAKYTENLIWYLIHEVHYGFYRPRLFEYNNNTSQKREIELPKIFWDERDYVMWKDLQIMDDGTAWLVGQQGHIIFYDGKKWNEFQSPVSNYDSSKLWAGDLNSIFMSDKNNGWAVGRNGLILKFTNGIWSIYKEGSEVEYFDVFLIEDEGWIVGGNSAILKLENGEWQNYKLKSKVNLKAIDGLSKDNIWICGENSKLLHFNGKEWNEINDIKIFEDDFVDLSIVKEENDNLQLWVLGLNGVYSVSQSFGFSYTNITSQAGLRREGILAIPIELNNDSYTDLIIRLDDSPPIVYQNQTNGTFAELSQLTTNIDINKSVASVTVGDINNDGYDDLFLLADENEFRVYLGNGNSSFKDISEYSELELNAIPQDTDIQTKLIDLNNDGNLDLYISIGNSQDMLFSNDGTGKFTNVYTSSGISKINNRRGFGAIFADFNNDNLIDLFMGYRFGFRDKYFDLYLNKGNFSFENIDSKSFYFEETKFPMSAVPLDYNNDGNMDIFVFSNSKFSFILENNGKAEFKYLDKEIGFGEEFLHPSPVNGIVASADVNSDGFNDLFIGSRLYINNNGYFEHITPYIGLDFVGNPTFVDYDNDMDYDLFIGSSRKALGEGDRFALFRNNLIEKNGVLISVYADESNRSAIGTTIQLKDSAENIQKYEIGISTNPLNGGYTRNQIISLNKNSHGFLDVTFPAGNKVREKLEGKRNIAIYESGRIDRYITLTYKSIERTIKLFNPINDSIKTLLFLIIFFSVLYYSKQTKAKKLTYTWYFPAVSFVIFLFLFHFTINTTFINEIGISVLLPAAFVLLFIYSADKYIEKKESKFISHYKLLEVIGFGGMGKVFKAIDISTKKTVAVKVINPQLTKDEENKKRLSSEGRLLSSINHPNIVKVFEVSETEKHTFIAMEYLEGGTLHDVIQHKYPFTLKEFEEIVLQICDGLHFIHSKEIIHRDLKSQNIMFDNKNKIRIMDFGLSKSPLVSTMTSLGTVVGTLGYVAPEQVTSIDVDKRTDLFSLGVILYQMLTNELPFTGENEIALIHSIFNTTPVNPSTKNQYCPKEIDKVILKLLSKEPSDRYSNVEEFKSEIIRIIK